MSAKPEQSTEPYTLETGEKMSPASPSASVHDLQNNDFTWTPAQETKVVRKIDAVVLTLAVLVATLEFLDKNALSYAAIFGLKPDTNTSAAQYSWLSSIFYFGYLAALPVTAYILPRVNVGRMVGVWTILWGVVVICTPACKSFASLAATRVLLGIFEAPIIPSFLLITPIWWKKSEHALRTSLWFNTFAGIFGGVFARGIATFGGNLHTWQYIYLIYGAATIACGVIVVFLLPEGPATAWFLNAEERRIAVTRLDTASDPQAGEHRFEWRQAWEALRSPMFLTLIVAGFFQSVTNAGVVNFNPIIINGFGYSPIVTTVLNIPQASVALVTQVALSYLAYKVKNIRSIIWAASALPALAGAVMVHTIDYTKNRQAALGGLYLMGFYNVAWVMMLSLSASNTAGRSKKAFVSSSMAVTYAVGNIVGPQFFIGSQSPHYPLGVGAMLVSFCVVVALGIVYYGLVRRAQALKDRDHSSTGTPDTLEDKTDKSDPSFEYSF